MGAPKGSKNGRGKKGRSGRKSYIQEKLRADLLVDSWFHEGLSLEELSAVHEKLKNKKGRVKLWDVFQMRSITNKNGTELTKQFERLYPIKQELKQEVEHSFVDWVKKIDDDQATNNEE